MGAEWKGGGPRRPGIMMRNFESLPQPRHGRPSRDQRDHTTGSPELLVAKDGGFHTFLCKGVRPMSSNQMSRVDWHVVRVILDDNSELRSGSFTSKTRKTYRESRD